jgi:hypothetical protein
LLLLSLFHCSLPTWFGLLPFHVLGAATEWNVRPWHNFIQF